MLSAKFLVVFILLFIFQDGAESLRRRRRRQCTPQDCQVSCWDSWSSCSASTYEREGSQSRSRSVTSYTSCGGGPCPELHESRQCYGSPTENCQLSSCSQWGACPAIRGNSSAIQTSTRHRITPEKCEEWHTSTIRKTWMCLREPVNCTGHSGENEKSDQGPYEWFRLTVNCTLFESWSVKRPKSGITIKCYFVG